MGKSILELFRTTPTSQIKTLDGNSIPYSGNTSAEKYDVRNSKDIVLSSNSGLMQPFFWAVNKLRTNETLTARTKEHLIEEETIGLRPLRAISTTVLYGSNLLRLTTKTTPTVVAMKQSSGGGEASGGLIGKLLTSVSKGSVNSLEQLTTTINSKLGIPQSLYPTSYANRFENDPVFDRMITIGEIKNDGKGTVLGKFLKQTGGGTPQQLSKQILGNAITVGKSAISKVLIGSTGPLGKNAEPGYSYNRPSDGRLITLQRFYSFDEFSYTAIRDNGIYTAPPLGKASATLDDTFRLKNGVVKGKNGLPIDMDSLKPPTLSRKRNKDISINEGLPSYAKSTNGNNTTVYGDKTDNLEKRGLFSDKDLINQTGRLTLKEADILSKGENSLEKMDLIPLRFQKMSDDSIVYMRSTITSFNETYTPSWESARMVGSPFNFYNYTSVERKLSFSLKVYAMSQAELLLMWTKLDYLAHLTFPAAYTDGVVQPNLFYFTLGNLYIDKPAILTGLTFAIDDNQSLWEIGGKGVTGKVKYNTFNMMNGTDFVVPNIANGAVLKSNGDISTATVKHSRPTIGPDNDTEIWNNLDEVDLTRNPIKYQNLTVGGKDVDMNNYKLPKFINASFDITFLETVQESSKNLYDTGKSITYGKEREKNASPGIKKHKNDNTVNSKDTQVVGPTPLLPLPPPYGTRK